MSRKLMDIILVGILFSKKDSMFEIPKSNSFCKNLTSIFFLIEEFYCKMYKLLQNYTSEIDTKPFQR